MAAITGYTYDELMLKHECPWAKHHVEGPHRLSSILNRCRELNLFDRCLFVKVYLFIFVISIFFSFSFSLHKQMMMIFYYIMIKTYYQNYPKHQFKTSNN
jgi:hypothetical protein